MNAFKPDVDVTAVFVPAAVVGFPSAVVGVPAAVVPFKSALDLIEPPVDCRQQLLVRHFLNRTSASRSGQESLLLVAWKLATPHETASHRMPKWRGESAASLARAIAFVR